MNELEPLCPDAPRLAPDRPLPRYRFVPELHPHPRRAPDGSLFGHPEHTPGRPSADWERDASFLFGIDLYHQGYLWESHEAFEACFFATDDPVHRRLLQALIQLAAAELQLHRGIANGVRILAARAVTHFEAVALGIAPSERLCGLCPAHLAAALRRRFAGAIASAAGTEGGDPLCVGRGPIRLDVTRP